MLLKTRVLDRQTGQVLFECDCSQADLAYEKAAELDAMGLDVVVDHPTVNQTLAASLGVEGAPMNAFQESLAQEIDEHPTTCCLKTPEGENIH